MTDRKYFGNRLEFLELKPGVKAAQFGGGTATASAPSNALVLRTIFSFCRTYFSDSNDFQMGIRAKVRSYLLVRKLKHEPLTRRARSLIFAGATKSYCDSSRKKKQI